MYSFTIVGKSTIYVELKNPVESVVLLDVESVVLLDDERVLIRNVDCRLLGALGMPLAMSRAFARVYIIESDFEMYRLRL